jgi:hypothetical protein
MDAVSAVVHPLTSGGAIILLGFIRQGRVGHGEEEQFVVPLLAIAFYNT